MEKQKNKCDTRIETVKYLKVIDKNKIWLIFNTASKVYKVTGHASSNPILYFFTKFQIYKLQTLNIRNMIFEKNGSYIGEVDMYSLKSVPIIFKITVSIYRLWCK